MATMITASHRELLFLVAHRWSTDRKTAGDTLQEYETGRWFYDAKADTWRGRGNGLIKIQYDKVDGKDHLPYELEPPFLVKASAEQLIATLLEGHVRGEDEFTRQYKHCLEVALAELSMRQDEIRMIENRLIRIRTRVGHLQSLMQAIHELENTQC